MSKLGKDTSCNAKHKKFRGAILISNKEDFRRRIITKDGRTLHNVKGSIQQGHVIASQNT